MDVTRYLIPIRGLSMQPAKPVTLLATALLMGLALTLALAGAAAPQPDVKLDVRETPLGPAGPVILASLTPSPDGRRLAYVTVDAAGKLSVLLDGKPVK